MNLWGIHQSVQTIDFPDLSLFILFADVAGSFSDTSPARALLDCGDCKARHLRHQRREVRVVFDAFDSWDSLGRQLQNSFFEPSTPYCLMTTSLWRCISSSVTFCSAPRARAPDIRRGYRKIFRLYRTPAHHRRQQDGVACLLRTSLMNWIRFRR